MAWRDQIRPASFRGVAFGVTGDDKEGGRRTVVHEFPQREDAFVEDMGGATTKFTVQAFVLGPDYMSQRDALEAALNEPGPGTLVHPWYGEIPVSQFAPYTVRHTASDGGMAVFTLSFARDAEPSSPASGINPQSRALDRIGQSGLLSSADFDSAFAVAGQAAHVVNAAYSSVSGAVGNIQSILGAGGGSATQIAGLLGAVTGYDFLAWTSIGQTLWSVYRVVGDAMLTSGKSEAALAGSWLGAASTVTAISAPETPGVTRARIAKNDTAIDTFTRQIAVVEAARLLTICEPESRSQARELREGFMDALDVVLTMGNMAAPSDALYASLVQTRAATLAALAASSGSAPDITVFTPAAVLPSLALCYRLSGGIDLEADMVARNGIIHPGFVPVARMEVLQ